MSTCLHGSGLTLTANRIRPIAKRRSVSLQRSSILPQLITSQKQNTRPALRSLPKLYQQTEALVAFPRHMHRDSLGETNTGSPQRLRRYRRLMMQLLLCPQQSSGLSHEDSLRCPYTSQSPPKEEASPLQLFLRDSASFSPVRRPAAKSAMDKGSAGIIPKMIKERLGREKHVQDKKMQSVSPKTSERS